MQANTVTVLELTTREDIDRIREAVSDATFSLRLALECEHLGTAILKVSANQRGWTAPIDPAVVKTEQLFPGAIDPDHMALLCGCVVDAAQAVLVSQCADHGTPF